MTLNERDINLNALLVDQEFNLTPLGFDLLRDVLRILAHEVDTDGRLTGDQLAKILSRKEMQDLIRREMETSVRYDYGLPRRPGFPAQRLSGVSVLHLISSRLFVRRFIEAVRRETDDLQFAPWIRFDKD